MDALSKHRSQHKVDFKSQSKRTQDVFALNRYVHKDLGREDRSELTKGKFYESALSKDKFMKRSDNIVPVFKNQIARRENVVSHDYSFDQVEIDPHAFGRRQVTKRIPQQIPFSKFTGREDNSMFRVSDGYNLDPNDKTYFDKFNVMDILSQSQQRSLSTANGFNDSQMTIKSQAKSATAIRYIKKVTEQIRQ